MSVYWCNFSLSNLNFYAATFPQRWTRCLLLQLALSSTHSFALGSRVQLLLSYPNVTLYYHHCKKRPLRKLKLHLLQSLPEIPKITSTCVRMRAGLFTGEPCARASWHHLEQGWRLLLVNVKTVWKSSFLMYVCGYGMRGETVYSCLCGYMACNGQRKNEACREIKIRVGKCSILEKFVS